MASPQLENGYTRIANELLEAIYRTRFSSHELRLLLVILRLTYGWGKKECAASLSYLSRATGIDKAEVSRAKAKLVKRVVLSTTPCGLNTLINKDYTKWLGVEDSSTLRKAQPKGCGKPNQGVEESPTNKESFKESLKEIVGHLNKLAGTSFKETTRITVESVSGRLAEGYTVDDFKAVHISRWAEWGKDAKMRQHFCPSTLYRPANFEKYLQAAKSSPPKPQGMVYPLLPNKKVQP